jgi:hypothetical protein
MQAAVAQTARQPGQDSMAEGRLALQPRRRRPPAWRLGASGGRRSWASEPNRSGARDGAGRPATSYLCIAIPSIQPYPARIIRLTSHPSDGPRSSRTARDRERRQPCSGDARLGGAEEFNPLTPCMPLTSRPLAPQYASTRCLISVLLSTQIAMKRHGAGCGDERLGCWQIAGSSGHRRLSVIARSASRWTRAPAVQCLSSDDFGSSVERTAKLHPL